jgi:GNAT superfamily N-acetyltransferase
MQRRCAVVSSTEDCPRGVSELYDGEHDMNGATQFDRTPTPRETLSFTLTDVPDAAARAIIDEELDRYNEQQTGCWDKTPLDIIIRDPSRRVIGGLIARTSLEVFFLDYLVIPDSLRGQGHGSRILAMAEKEAIRRGCATAVVFTMAVQAPAFYEKHGYVPFGRVECQPPGNARIFMKKALVPKR